MHNRLQNFVSSRNYLDVVERFTNVGFWNADMTTGEISGTDGFFRILGLTKAETFTLHNWTALLHPDDREDFRSIYPVINMGVSASRELRIVDQQRPTRRIRVAVEEPVTTGRMIGLVQDISGEREAKAMVVRERARINAIIRMAGGILWARDRNGFVADLRGWETITGQSPEQCANEGWLDAVHPGDRERVLETWKACLCEEVPCELSYRLRYSDQIYRKVLARSAPLRQENGETVEWIGMIEEVWRRDAPDHAEIEAVTLKPQQLRAARAMLGWSAEDLAGAAQISVATIRRYESTTEHMKEATVSAIVAAFEKEGLIISSSDTEMSIKLRQACG